MKTWSRRAVTAVTIATLIGALATLGGYRLAGSHGSVPRSVRLAAGPFNETWVSAAGHDSNSSIGCPRLTACQTIAGAVGVTASSGAVEVMDPCPCSGATITHAVTIDGLGGGKASVNSSLNGINVEAGPNDVVILRHLQFEGLGVANGDGIKFISGKALILDDVTIEGFAGDGVDAQLGAGGSTLSILNSRIHNNGLAGIAITTSSGTVHTHVSHSFVENNTYGIINGDGSALDLSDSVIADNTSIGLGAQTFGNLPSLVHATHDQLENNPYAVWENHGAGNAQIIIWLADNDVVNNTTGIYGNFGGTLAVFSFGNNRFANNGVNGAPNGTATQT